MVDSENGPLQLKAVGKGIQKGTVMDDIVFNLGETVESNWMTQGSSPGFVLFNISYDSYTRHRKCQRDPKLIVTDG